MQHDCFHIWNTHYDWLIQFNSIYSILPILLKKQCLTRKYCHRVVETIFIYLFFISLFLTARQACYLPKKPGECVGHYLRYYYSPEHHTCKSFYWTGCEGNGNRFLSLNMCNATCHNAVGMWLIVTLPRDLYGKAHVNVYLFE